MAANLAQTDQHKTKTQGAGNGGQGAHEVGRERAEAGLPELSAELRSEEAEEGREDEAEEGRDDALSGRAEPGRGGSVCRCEPTPPPPLLIGAGAACCTADGRSWSDARGTGGGSVSDSSMKSSPSSS
jgi:hypothetical protein